MLRPIEKRCPLDAGKMDELDVKREILNLSHTAAMRGYGVCFFCFFFTIAESKQ